MQNLWSEKVVKIHCFMRTAKRIQLRLSPYHSSDHILTTPSLIPFLSLSIKAEMPKYIIKFWIEVDSFIYLFACLFGERSFKLLKYSTPTCKSQKNRQESLQGLLSPDFWGPQKPRMCDGWFVVIWWAAVLFVKMEIFTWHWP